MAETALARERAQLFKAQAFAVVAALAVIGGDVGIIELTGGDAQMIKPRPRGERACILKLTVGQQGGDRGDRQRSGA